MVSGFDPTAAQRFRCLQGLGEADLEQLGRHLEPVRYADGQVLFCQGEAGDGAYLLLAGRVELRVEAAGQGERVLATLGGGSLFGEISPLLDEPRSATAVARSGVWLWRLPKRALRGAMEAGEAWVAKFLLATVQVMAQRLVVMNKEVSDLIGELKKAESKPPAARVAELERLRNRLNTEWSF